MRIRGDVLFGKYDLSGALHAQEQQMMDEIDVIPGSQVLNSNIEDLCNYFEQKFQLNAPQLRESEITVGQSETQVDVSGDPRRMIFDRSQPFYLKGTSITFFVPFEGDPDFFQCRPSICTLSPLCAVVNQGELALIYTRTDHDAAVVKSEFDRDLSRIRDYLKQIAQDVSPFNASIRTKARERLESRRQKLLKDLGLVAALGFPLRQRDGVPRTYVAPTVRRKVNIPMPRASTAPFVPEPTLDIQEYEHILSVISNMVAVMERSPKAFSGMNEEDLRQHFLVQLNGQYEGQATGETFNFEGKTDILIRVEGKNIFIAECKFWHGPESLKKAIDQLLGYATWRDTKTALLIFNRDREFSSVLTKIPEVVKSHPNFKREMLKSETGFRFVLHHRDDKNRELILTVLAFEVPV